MAGKENSIGRFRVLSRLGQGGMAEVFKCDVTGVGGFNKVVVVKRILPEFELEDQYVQMFLKEAKIQALLNHANVLQVFEVGIADGAPFMAMEFANGPTLRQVIRTARKEKNLHYGHMARIVSEVAAGLQYCHQATTPEGKPLNLIHRDVTPHNIIVTKEGVPKLLDFGVAKADGQSEVTRAGEIKGKLAYLAPEQINGGTATKQSDVYSLGVTLYMATVGAAPYRMTTAATMLRDALAGAFKLPSTRIRNYPPGLEKLVVSTLNPDPNQRCASAAELHDALETLINSPGQCKSSRAGLTAWLTELFPSEEHYRRNAWKAYASSDDSDDSRGSGSLGFTPSASNADLASEASLSGRPTAVETPADLQPTRNLSEERLRTRSRWPLVAIAAGILLLAGVGVGVALTGDAPTEVGPQTKMAISGVTMTGLAPAEKKPPTQAAEEISYEEVDESEIEVEEGEEPATGKLKTLKRKRGKVQTGRLLVSSSPPGDLFLDGRLVGRTPKTFHKLPVGDHVISVRAPGHEDVERTVRVVQRKRIRLKLTLAQDLPEPPPPPPPMVVAKKEPPKPAPKLVSKKPPPPKKAASEFPKPRLPQTHAVSDAREMIRIFRMVEEEVAVHSDGVAAKNVTLDLGKAIAKEVTGGPVEVYPRAMYFLIMKQLKRGASSSEIGAKLKSAHYSGALK